MNRFDVIHVNGGNTFYLLLQALKSGFAKWIIDAVRGGKIYIGSSAGAIVASPDISMASTIDTNRYEEELEKLGKKGIDLVDVLILPHWGTDYFKDLYLNHRLDIAYKAENKIVLLNDYQFLRSDGDSYVFVDIRTEK